MLKRDFNENWIRKETDEKGTTRYYDADGELHRDDGPAMVEKGLAAWVRHGKLHRENGPAIEADSGSIWYRSGKLHRDDGPAIEIPSMHGRGDEWWVDDKQFTKVEFELLALKTRRNESSVKPH